MTDRQVRNISTSVENGKQRIDEIDVAKALGIICVLIGHKADGTVHNYIYLFHMPLFFILSGYMMKTEKLSFLHILFRDNKLISTYLTYSIIVAIFNSIQKPNLYTFFSNVGNTCTLYGIGTLWFLSSLWIAKFVIRVARNISNNIARHSLIFIIYAFCYLLSILLLSINYNGLIGQLARSLSWSIVRAGVILIFVYLGHIFKEYISMFLVFFREHYGLCFCFSMASGALLIPFVQFDAVDYHLLKNGLFILDIIYGVVGTLFILSISAIIVHFLNIIKELFINIGKSSVHYMASECFGFFGYFSAFFHKMFDTFPYVKYVSFGVYLVILFCTIRLIGPFIDKAINALTRKLDMLGNNAYKLEKK